MASYQYVYVMKDLTKAFPGGREVFKGITLSFLPGVKIGVLGVNGAGKSTLMKIMAGIETEFGGEAWAAPGATVGYLAQEPRLDPDKTVGENVEEAFTELKAALDRVEEKHTLFGDGIETVAFKHRGTRKRSALAHTMAAGETVAVAVRTARDSVAVAFRAVI